MLKTLWSFREAFRASLLTIPDGWTDINETHRVEHLSNFMGTRSGNIKCIERRFFAKNPQPFKFSHQEDDE